MHEVEYRSMSPLYVGPNVPRRMLTRRIHSAGILVCFTHLFDVKCISFNVLDKLWGVFLQILHMDETINSTDGYQIAERQNLLVI